MSLFVVIRNELSWSHVFKREMRALLSARLLDKFVIRTLLSSSHVSRLEIRVTLDRCHVFSAMS